MALQKTSPAVFPDPNNPNRFKQHWGGSRKKIRGSQRHIVYTYPLIPNLHTSKE